MPFLTILHLKSWDSFSVEYCYFRIIFE